MGRLREFEPQEVVWAAIPLFARNGYAGTSLKDLEDGLGVNRASLYNVFGDKKRLFLAALDAYNGKAIARISETLAQPGSAIHAITKCMYYYSPLASGELGRMGCLLINSALSMTPSDADVTMRLERTLRRMEDLFAGAIIRAETQGEIAGGRDDRALARYLVGCIQGLRVLGKAGPTQEQIDDVIETALSALTWK